MPPSTCAHLRDPNPWTVALAAFILAGILVSYLPQHLKIIARRSSDGLSPWWVLLGGLSSIAAIGNILVLPQSRADVRCCRVVSGGECAGALLGVAQIGLQWACFMFIVMLFLTFFPTKPQDSLATSTPSLASTTSPPRRSDALVVGTATLAALLTVGLVSTILILAFPRLTQTWADVLGTLAGSLAAVQYLPQIYFTFVRKSVGSLSIVTMLIQVPGAFLFALSLGLRVGWEGWSTWLVYIVTGVLQAVVLGLAVVYTLRGGGRGQRQQQQEETEEETEDDEQETDGEEDRSPPGERTALLSSNGSSPNGGKQKSRPIQGSDRRSASQRQLSMLYAATPPEHDSDRS